MSSLTPREGLLDVYLGDNLLGRLDDRTLGYVGFEFAPEALARHGAGARVLSVAIPVSSEPVDAMVATPFFAGLLPEGDILIRIAAEFQLEPIDTYGLLAAIGRECAGALTIIPERETPAAEHDVRWLTEQELADTLLRLEDTPLGIDADDDEGVRISMAGAQDKLPVVIDDDDRIGLPQLAQPSTHILKPPSSQRDRQGRLKFPEIVANEAFCLAFAAALEIPTTSFRVLTVAGDPVLAIERYDRFRTGEDKIERLHQEDVCQALGIWPGSKYESAGGPSLAAAAELLSRTSARPAIDQRTLYWLTVANSLIANMDAHGKNVSLLHAPEGIRLAPAYDLVATQVYAHPSSPAMRIGRAARLDQINRDALLAAAADSGFAAKAGARLLDELLDRVPGAIEQASERASREGFFCELTERIVQGIEERRRLYL